MEGKTAQGVGAVTLSLLRSAGAHVSKKAEKHYRKGLCTNCTQVQILTVTHWLGMDFSDVQFLDRRTEETP